MKGMDMVGYSYKESYESRDILCKDMTGNTFTYGCNDILVPPDESSKSSRINSEKNKII
jgi:hypothetical protein